MTIALLYSEEMKRYDFGPGHPFRGDRYACFIKLFKEKVGMEEVKRTVKEVRSYLSPFWHCFRRS
jgi:acetoin utilization deacetylase AcuC-like enzyme